MSTMCGSSTINDVGLSKTEKKEALKKVREIENFEYPDKAYEFHSLGAASDPSERHSNDNVECNHMTEEHKKIAFKALKAKGGDLDKVYCVECGVKFDSRKYIEE
jgi:hypothetical protein